MTSLSSTEIPQAAACPFGTLVDVGGGQGSLLAALLRANPHVHGVLFDVPAVIERARRDQRDGLRGHWRLRPALSQARAARDLS